MPSGSSIILSQLIFFCVFFSCGAQPYYFKHYQADKGLAHNSVSTIIQDRKGLMWIGTRAGLNRFDGYTFKTYKNKKDKLGNIGNNVVVAIAEDQQGMLWIGTGKGIFKYDPLTEIFTLLEIAPQNYISHILIDQENNVLFLANRMLYKFNRKDNKVLNLNIQASCMAIDGIDLWIGNDQGQIQYYNPQNKLIRSISVMAPSVPANMRSISKICPAKNHELLIGCFKQGLKSYHTKTGLIRSLPLNDSYITDTYVRDITAGSNQDYWIATESGIYIYNLSSHTCSNLRKGPGDPYSIADNAVYTVCRDNQGGMWAGTFFGGLSYYSEKNARFEKYYPQAGSKSISGNAVREICPDHKGNLWIGTEDAGVNKFDLKTKTFTNYTATGAKSDLSYPNIHGLLALGNQLYTGPFLHGMEVMDIPTGRITDRFKRIGENNEMSSDFVISIYLTRDSSILIGTAYNKGSGLFEFDKKRKVFNRIKQIPPHSYVYQIFEDSQGYIWTGSVGRGAFYYHPKTGRQGNIRFGDRVGDQLVNEFPIHGITEDSNHAMWFTTEGGGLIRVSPDRKVVKKFSVQDGLPSNVLFMMLEDDSRHLWISSLKGLVRFDMETEKFRVYTQFNGLITDQFNFNSAYKDNNGKMYFGSVKGMIAFHPEEFDDQEPQPPTYITGFQINNKEISPGNDSTLRKSILYTDTVVLDYDQNNFSIEFAALNYAAPEVIRYEYVMDGLNSNVTFLNSNRKAYFTGLSPGDYNFTVRAKSNIGSWTGKERHLFIKIRPPFWLSYTGFFIYLFLFIAFVFCTARYYDRYLEGKNRTRSRLFEHEKEKEIYHAKIEFFTHIAHEIQTPLTLILGPVERMVKNTGEQEVIRKSLLMVETNARRLADLTTQLLDFRKTEMHEFGLNFVSTDISRLLTDQVAAFKQEAEERNISLNLLLPQTPLAAFADKEALVKICSNLISNAIKYGNKTASISLHEVDITDQQFVVKFSNDGKGIPDEFSAKVFEPFFRLDNEHAPGTGIGLSLAKSLAEMHHGALTLVSGHSDKIIFELTLPVRQKFEFELGSWKKII
ncbi:two-component system sensor histidine kinase/response regulator hybrid [Pedobacter sp. BAL39]|uniref:ligand-binding sensor domain-containing protein n=1 Tax=Pedobacter sp. BAL39 TaxID=391596 RepID=UPI0001559D32|nr:sensor histidine kinase [Pedobacter sp. BAL39]EDM35852.1 two-component system sensor histidine kinase/response regulator hybrid [Pedobacter sp. BAL39]